MTCDQELGVVFVSATRNTPSARRFYRPAFFAALERNGVRTTVLTPTTKMISLPWSRTRGYVGTRGLPVSLRFLLDLARSPAPFVHCSEYGLETLAALAVTRLRGRRGLVFQEHVGRAGAPLSSVDVHYRRLIGRLATAFLPNTPGAQDEIVGLLRVDPAKVFQIMTLVPPDRDYLRRSHIDLGQPAARPLFLYSGQLIRRKNVDAILKAASLLREDGLGFEVWLGGEGADEERLRRIARERGLDGAVRFIGQIPYPSVGFAYDACDVFIMPSHADLLSVAVLEAMRFGKAVICSTSVGAAGSVAHDQHNALVFDPDQPSQLAESMRQFIVDPALAVLMGRRSAAIMEEHTPDAAAAAFVDVLRRLTPSENGRARGVRRRR